MLSMSAAQHVSTSNNLLPPSYYHTASARIEGITDEGQQARQQQMPIGHIDLHQINKYLQSLPNDHFSLSDTGRQIRLDTYPPFVKQFQKLTEHVHKSIA